MLVENGPSTGGDGTMSPSAPVVYEDHPTLANLIGRIEHLAQFGTLVTDFMLIKAGALHRANGGCLILDAQKLLSNAFAYETLKRALRSAFIRIESAAEQLCWSTTMTLEPEPIPLEIKVVLLGEPLLYYMLNAYDPEFSELFRVAADFETSMDRDEDGTRLYARLIGTQARRAAARPLNRAAVGRMVEHASRLAGDAWKLTTHTDTIEELIREADFWAGEAGATAIGAEHVQQAIDARVFLSDRLRARIQEEIRRGTLIIESEGEVVGQVNGLAVLQLDRFAFGKPSRISARVRLGKGEVIDIEREVALGGPLHSKGVLILASYLATRYASEQPLSLSANLVFEQSYGGVAGDSASSTELYALLSALAEIPIRQSLAVTGSVDQLGHVQAIGGVNERGFLRRLRRARPDGRSGRADSGGERQAPDAAQRRRRSLLGRPVPRLPDAKVEALRRVLRGETVIAAAEHVEIERSLPHGHVAAVLGTLRAIGLDRLLPRRPERLARLALALIVARVVEPAAKLATARQLSGATAAHSLGAVLGVGEVDEDELYRALDVLGAAQPAIEKALARRHLKDGMLVLYDVTSSYLEGRCCELARFGRDGRPDRPQIVFGLLCAADGCPVAVEVFAGDTADPKTLAARLPLRPLRR